MEVIREGKLVGYAKIMLRSQFPRRWGWFFYPLGHAKAVAQSTETFRTAEEAWAAARGALASQPVESADQVPVTDPAHGA